MSTFDQRYQRVDTQINIAELVEKGGCPECQRVDKIEKISTVNKLLPPPKPEPKHIGCGWAVGIIVLSLYRKSHQATLIYG